MGLMVVAGRVMVWDVALSAWAVRVPGLVEVLVRAMVHSAAAREIGGAVVGEGEVGGGELEVGGGE